MLSPLSWISALFALPKLGETSDPATTALGRHKMVARRSIYPVLDTIPLTSDIHTFIGLIESAHSPDFDFDQRLERCQVTHVTHYRSKSIHANEVIIIEMTYVGDDSFKEMRLFRLDRFRVDFIKDSVRGTPEGGQSCRLSDKLKGRPGGLLSDDYRPIRDFGIPLGKMSLGEALVIADTLGSVSQEYSNFVHICQLWAANLFSILRTVASRRLEQNVAVRDGPAAGDAGTAHGFKLVDSVTGRASHELLNASDEHLKRLVISLSGRSLAVAAVGQLVTTIRKDIQLLSMVIASSSDEPGIDPTPVTSRDNFMSTRRISVLAKDSLDRMEKRIRNTIESRVNEQYERTCQVDAVADHTHYGN
ncbi:hypothetical protein BKA62DRAFT_797649 [Auriculariales sp. MPI-PUGE-AT-0066]|nr:hypothetical protein BKA62DRAFT_797649 [Auriculariales sp. MPI-PUGE-AT-0066]